MIIPDQLMDSISVSLEIQKLSNIYKFNIYNEIIEENMTLFEIESMQNISLDVENYIKTIHSEDEILMLGENYPKYILRVLESEYLYNLGIDETDIEKSFELIIENK